MTQDLVIGTTSGYDLEILQYWINSLDSCGFSGRKVVLVCNGPRDVLDHLSSRGYQVVTYARDEATGAALFPHDEFQDEDASARRFGLMWQYLTTLPQLDAYRYVIAADTRDVIFQSNPSEWLTANIGDKELNVSSEGVVYADEPWNNQSLLENFGDAVHRRMLQRVVWNAGVIAGTVSVFRDLCLTVDLFSRAWKTTYGDQAALNVTLSTQPYQRMTRFSLSEDGWACHAGTMCDPALKGKLKEPEPFFDGEYVYTSSGKKYCVVHQYDRVSGWHSRLREKYAFDRP